MQRKDYYGILGVSKDADDNAIKLAYRRLAFRNHPDTNRDDPQAEDRFKGINEAYEVLSHTEKRNQYDLGRDTLTGGSPFPRPPFDSWSNPFEESFFSEFRCRGGGFGRGLRRKRQAQSADFGPPQSDLHIHDLPLTSDEAFKGTERDIRLHTGRDTLVFTVSIPAGVGNGSLFSSKCSLENGQEIELLFRVSIVE
jgi:molecular chaperone DnaJ